MKKMLIGIDKERFDFVVEESERLGISRAGLIRSLIQHYKEVIEKEREENENKI